MNITLSTKHSRPFPTQLPTTLKNGSITRHETAPELRDSVVVLYSTRAAMAPTTDNPSANSTPHRIIENTTAEDPIVHYSGLNPEEMCSFTQSCSQKCSNETIFSEHYHGGSVCSCDRACVSVFMDCCGDYAAECKTSDSDQPTDDFVYKQRTLMHCEAKLNIWQRGVNISAAAGVWMVIKCPTYWSDDNVRTKCQAPSFHLQVENYSTYIPVFSHATNLTYRNRYCALCNNVSQSQYEFWNLLFAKYKYFISLFYTKGFEEFLKFNLQDFMGLGPNDAAQPIRYCHFPNAISSCPAGGRAGNSSTADACVNGDVALVRGEFMKNEKCLRMNTVRYAMKRRMFVVLDLVYHGDILGLCIRSEK